MTFRVDVFTLFPQSVASYADVSVLARAAERGVYQLRTHDIRDAATGVHRSVDDTPFGGGAGMVLRADVLFDALDAVPDAPRPLLALTPSGRPFTQARARELAAGDGVSLLCGRYEGFDQRVLDHRVDEEVSLGDFVLAGGELAALCLFEAVVRLLPGALGNDDSPTEESFSAGLLEYPQYTKPAEVRGLAVPEVLRSGDHGRIERWRRARALERTAQRRPDLYGAYELSDEDRRAMAEFGEMRDPETSG